MSKIVDKDNSFKFKKIFLCIGCVLVTSIILLGAVSAALSAADTTNPSVYASVKSGLYNTNKVVSLTMNEPGTIYYTRNGTTPTTRSTKYTGPITITSTTVLKFIAVDLAKNKSPVNTRTYTIDKIHPKIISWYPTKCSTTQTFYFKFNEKIKSSSSWSKIYVKNRNTGKIVPSSKWISGNVLYVKTTYKRIPGNWYTVDIPYFAVKDYAGNDLYIGLTVSFRTAG